MFRYSIQQGYLSSNPVKPVPSKSENNKRIWYLSTDERERLLEAVKSSKWDKLELLVTLALTTGARRYQRLIANKEDRSWKACRICHQKIAKLIIKYQIKLLTPQKGIIQLG